MARHGVALAAARADTVHRLDAAARLGVGPFPRAALAMAGEIDGWLAVLPALDAALVTALGGEPGGDQKKLDNLVVDGAGEPAERGVG